jgi:dipeptidyl aminopeptidase/acylaminoacyl peptidase
MYPRNLASSTAAILLVFARPTVAEEPRGSITVERIAAIKHPSDAAWSPDGERIAFLWDSAGNQNLFVVTPGGSPRPLTDFAPRADDLSGDIGGFEWISNEEVLLLREGKLHRVSASRAIESKEEIDGVQEFAVSPQRDRVAFVRAGQMWVRSLSGGEATRLTDLDDPHRASSIAFSKDGRRIAFIANRTERVVDLLGYNGNKLGLYRNQIDGWQVGIVSAAGGAVSWIAVDGRPGAVQWLDDREVLFEQISHDMRTREIVVASAEGATRLLRRDRDSRWWSPIRRDARTVVSPDGKLVAFFSDETGWAHLYVQPTEAGSTEARQLTSGEFEAGFGSWSRDGKRIAFYDGRGSLMERFIHVVDVPAGQITPVVTQKGVSYWPRLSPDAKRVVFERTDVENSVDLYVAEVGGASSITRLTQSMPPEIDRADLTAPVAVSFPSRVEGKEVPATLFVPESLDRSRKHPAIVWIHGSGSDQNFLGWHPFSYRMYYSANQYLAQQGYVVLAVDYRGSSGYGRDWGTGHHLDLGGPDALDVASGADYLKTLPYVDADRIGVWGLSYGGFLTLQVLIRTPTLFRCGINVAGVSDWETWGMESNGGWITGRMRTPEDNPEGYLRTASIRHMETLERPLLILHGTADVNVAFRESLNLVDVLLKLGKDFDFEVYPGELHFFRREHILRDAWRRAERFFDGHLKDGPRLASR